MKNQRRIFVGFVLVMAGLLGFACKLPNNGEKPETPKYAVTFGVNGEHGKLTASLDGKEFHSGDKVEKGKVLVFMAVPDVGYEVNAWTGAMQDAADKNKASIKAEKEVSVAVKFTARTDTPYTVKHLLQNIKDDSYDELKETETLTGTTGQNTNAVAKNYEGFEQGEFSKQKIKADGSTVIEIKYNRKQITLVLDLAGGKIEPAVSDNKITGRFGAKVSKPSDPTKAGYNFAGWIPEIPDVFPAKDTSFVAQWTREGDYTIIYHLNGGTDNGSNPAGYNVETPTITLKEPKREGYSFSAWFDNAELSGNKVTQIAKGSTGNKEFWAKWEANTDTKYIVKHLWENRDDDKYTVHETANLTGTTDKLTNAPAKTYHGFTAQSFDQKMIKGDGSTEIEIKYKRNIITLKLDLNGGTGSKSISGKFEASVQVPNDIKKPGYNIARWNPWEPELPDTFLVEDDGKTYKVMWAPGLVGYTIRHLWQNIDDNDYTVHEEVKNPYGATEQKTKAEPKVYEGFTIVTPIQQETIKGDGSTVVEIKYNRNIISLTLNFDDGKIEPPLLNNKIIGRFGANVPKPNNPTRDCYVFGEWNPKIPDTFPAKDMSYTAGWKIGEAISVELWDGKTLDAIKIPAATMSGKPHDEALYGPLPEYKYDPWRNKGVCGFNEETKNSFSKFVISKTEVPYWLWYDVRVWAEEQGYEFTNKGREGRNGEVGAKPTANKNQPVTDISWRECIVWCNAFTEKMKGNTSNGVYLTKLYGTSGPPIRSTERRYQGQNECDIAKFEKSRKGFRLPTEVEWEYSARVAKDGTLCPLNYLSGASANYTDDEACKKVAWYNANADEKIHPVGEKAPNDLGLYDMSGNVSEWCWDQLFDWRVVRGGSHIDKADRCIVGYRESSRTDNHGIETGFRLVWSE